METNQTTVAELLLRPDLISAVAKLLWPLVAAFSVWIFRSDIRTLLERLDSAKFGKNELRFAKEATEFKNIVEGVIAETEKIANAIPTDKPTAPQLKTEPAQVQRLRFHDHEPDRVNEENGTQARKFVSPEQPLLPRSLTWQAGTDLPSHIQRNPHEAIFLIHAELDRAIREILLSDGVALKNNMSLSRLATVLQSRRKLSSEFDNAVQQFSHLRNRVAHSFKKIPDQELAEVAKSGLHLLDLLGRIPRERIIVQRAAIPVFSDEACKIRANEYEGVHLMFAAMPGCTGNAMAAVSQRLRHYRVGETVSSEWGDMTRTDLWMVGLDDKLKKISAGNTIFVGRHLTDLVNA